MCNSYTWKISVSPKNTCLSWMVLLIKLWLQFVSSEYEEIGKLSLIGVARQIYNKPGWPIKVPWKLYMYIWIVI